MPLLGALSNHGDHLARLDKLKQRLLQAAATNPRLPIDVAARLGATQRAVIETLKTQAGNPMSVMAIMAGVEALLARPLSRGAVEGCISARTRGKRPLFVRVKPGWYRLAESS